MSALDFDNDYYIDLTDIINIIYKTMQKDNEEKKNDIELNNSLMFYYVKAVLDINDLKISCFGYSDDNETTELDVDSILGVFEINKNKLYTFEDEDIIIMLDTFETEEIEQRNKLIPYIFEKFKSVYIKYKDRYGPKDPYKYILLTSETKYNKRLYNLLFNLPLSYDNYMITLNIKDFNTTTYNIVSNILHHNINGFLNDVMKWNIRPKTEEKKKPINK